MTDSQEILCDCGKMHKDSRRLKIPQAKTNCQMPENKLIAPTKNCFISLNDIILSSCLTFENTIFYKTSSNKFFPISNAERPVSSNKYFVQVKDNIVNPLDKYLNNDISTCGKETCLTCKVFIKDQSFTSNLTRKKYNAITYENLSCGSANVVYGIRYVHCGLVYAGQTGRSLRSRISGHKASIQNKGQSLLHRHFHQPNHSVDDMRVHILEKIYCSPNQAKLSTLFRRDRELFWIKELGTAKPYGFNDQVEGVGTLSSPSSKKINVYTSFNNQSRRELSHGKRHQNKKAPQQELSMTLVDIVDMIDQPLRVFIT